MAALDDLAQLRIKIFRDWPYLYEGDLDYEREYLTNYHSEGAIVVVAYDGAKIVGAATGTPMEDHADDFSLAFAHRAEPLNEIFYCAESILLPQYRGRGIGHAFFDEREAHGRKLGRKYSAFCSVVRPLDHPLRPADYRPLDAFWVKRGYRLLPGVVAEFPWKDIGAESSSNKPMQFWMREL